MGTSGLTAQADGRGDASEVAAWLERALLIAAAAGLLLLVLRAPIAAVAFELIGGSAEVETAGRIYYDIRSWSAPFTFANFAILGWLIGLGRARHALGLQLLLNLVNIALAMLLTLGWGWGVAGVGVATLASEIATSAAGLALARHEIARRGGRTTLARVLDPAAMRRALAVNGDIMIRTLALEAAFLVFTAQSARAGDVVLAANAILFDLFGFMAYFLDGFAHAAETHVGRAVGGQVRARLVEAVRLSAIWSGTLSLAVGIAFWLLGEAIVALMTASPEVRLEAGRYLAWAALSPVVGVACFLLDGVFIGATRTADMRNMMLLSLAAFLATAFALQPSLGNHGLWAAMMVFFVVRAITLGARVPALLRDSFPTAPLDADPRREQMVPARAERQVEHP